MQKIISYILNGRGSGKRLLLILSLVMTVMASFPVWSQWKKVLSDPAFLETVKQIPSISIENGKVVKPENYNEQIDLGESNMQFVINTQVDSLSTEDLNSGLYLTKEKLYVVNGQDVSVQSLDSFGSVRWTTKDYENLYNKLLWATVFSFAFVFMAMAFVVFYVSVLLYALCSYVVTWVMKTGRVSFAARRRMSVVCFVIGYLVFLPTSYIDFYTGTGLFLITVLFVQVFFLKQMSKQVLTKTD